MDTEWGRLILACLGIWGLFWLIRPNYSRIGGPGRKPEE